MRMPRRKSTLSDAVGNGRQSGSIEPTATPQVSSMRTATIPPCTNPTGLARASPGVQSRRLRPLSASTTS